MNHNCREGGSPKLCGRHTSVPQSNEGCDDRPAPPVHLVAHGDLRLGAPRRRHRRPLPRGQPGTHLEGRPAPHCQVRVCRVLVEHYYIYQKDQAITLDSKGPFGFTYFIYPQMRPRGEPEGDGLGGERGGAQLLSLLRLRHHGRHLHGPPRQGLEVRRREEDVLTRQPGLEHHHTG